MPHKCSAAPGSAPTCHLDPGVVPAHQKNRHYQQWHWQQWLWQRKQRRGGIGSGGPQDSGRPAGVGVWGQDERTAASLAAAAAGVASVPAAAAGRDAGPGSCVRSAGGAAAAADTRSAGSAIRAETLNSAVLPFDTMHGRQAPLLLGLPYLLGSAKTSRHKQSITDKPHRAYISTA